MSTLDRRRFLHIAAAGAAAALAPHATAQRRPPNIIFLLADDMGSHQLGCYGNPFYETPRLDALAREGMRFTSAYAAAPVCSPTRASIMTGKYPARLHLTEYIPGNPFPYAKLKQPDWTKHLPIEAVTLAEYLTRAGYACGHFGKWHLSIDKEYKPGRPGDPDTQGFSDVLALDKPESNQEIAASADPNYDAHRTREIIDRAIAFAERNRDHPFFAYVPFSAIHRPEMEYGPRVFKYARKPEMSNEMGNNPILAAMMETMDTQIGRLVDAIDRLGLKDDTLIIFFSDNGDLYGREGRKPHRGAKCDLYEGGIRMPMIARWPGAVPAGAVSDARVCSIDFLPTFCELANVPIDDPDIDGISIAAALRGQPFERGPLYWHYPHYHTLAIGPSGAIQDGRFKLIEWFEGGPTPLELYDLEADPGERSNLAAAQPERAAALLNELKDWRTRVRAQEMPPNPNYDPKKSNYKGPDR